MKHIFNKAKLVGATAVSCALLTGFAFAQGAGFKRQELVLGDRAGASYGISEGGNRVPATVTQLKAIDQVIIVLDASNSMTYLYGKAIDEVQQSIPSNVAVPTMIIRFSEELVVLQDYTTSRTDLVDTLKKEAGSWSNGSSDRTMKVSTHLYDAITKLSEYTKGKNTHIMLLTDGMDSRNRIANLPDIIKTDMVVSYLNWGWRDFSLKVDEPNSVQLGGGRARMADSPRNALAVIARYSGGDVQNFTDWKAFRAYFNRRLANGGAVYQATWDSANPEVPFTITSR